MCNKIHYYFDDSTGILTRVLEGKIFFSDIIDSWENIIQTYLNNGNVNGVITDARKAEMVFGMEETQNLQKYFNKAEKRIYFENLPRAVVSNSTNIAFPMFVQHTCDTLYIKTFSTIEAAKTWIIQRS